MEVSAPTEAEEVPQQYLGERPRRTEAVAVQSSAELVEGVEGKEENDGQLV
jgi:hypothetical protein